jgi:hypothetical protein
MRLYSRNFNAVFPKCINEWVDSRSRSGKSPKLRAFQCLSKELKAKKPDAAVGINRSMIVTLMLRVTVATHMTSVDAEVPPMSKTFT